jgi:putative FmdB family regulatory protein
MPTYDYTCSACGHRFERFESIRDDAPKPCPKCNKKKAKRMLGTGAGLIFKGSGFYTTDYKNKSSAGGDSGSASGDSEKKSEPKDKKKKEEKESKK